jgi:hypothetical protein
MVAKERILRDLVCIPLGSCWRMEGGGKSDFSVGD